MSKVPTTMPANSELTTLLESGSYLNIPKVGDLVKGVVISLGNNEVYIDMAGIATGVIRGREFFDESGEYTNLTVGQEIEATVIDQENEDGEMELSIRFAGHQKAWENLEKIMAAGEILKAQILDANKGGLMIKVAGVRGFLPVSQLTPEHYPRVQGGDKAKILEILKSYANQEFDVKIIDVKESENKLIVSERDAWESSQNNALKNYKIGDAIEGSVTAVTDFGAFVQFGDHLEGLVHISEIAWQRIDNPADHLHPGDQVKAEIIDIQGSKIFLSMKKLSPDPWHAVAAKYKVGDIVEGKVLKINPFGLFVELDNDIHGLAHISELSDRPIKSAEEVGKPGETMKFRIVSLEPTQHRLGLSIKAMKDKPKEATEPATEKTAPQEAPAPEAVKAEEPAPAAVQEQETEADPLDPAAS